MRIVVLTGGDGAERAVSLRSGQAVSEALRQRGHRVWTQDVRRGTLARVLPLCCAADAVFLALHGDMGENGQLQAVLDRCGIRYTGSGCAASLLAMEKPLAKLLLRQGGVLTPDWVEVAAGTSTAQACADIGAAVGYPCVIKPCDGGSSVGVCMADSPRTARAALAAAARRGARMMAERRVCGRELTVAVLGQDILPAVELIPRRGFYDYRNKYEAGRTREICPAPLDARERQALHESARRACAVLGLRDYARGDYMLDGEGQLWCLEWNTLPGMTATSLLPLAARTAGLDMGALCERMLQGAAHREEKPNRP